MPIKRGAKELGVSEVTMYELVNDGHIKSLKIGSRRHVVSSSLLAYIDRQTKAAQPRDPRVAKMHAAKAAKRATRPKLIRRGA
jgi:excisionase family DNA binding protein